MEEIRKLLESDKLLIGTDRSIKALKMGKLEKIYISSNCPDDVTETIDRYAGETELIKLDVPNEELGVICRKPFLISVVGVLKSK